MEPDLRAEQKTEWRYDMGGKAMCSKRAETQHLS